MRLFLPEKGWHVKLKKDLEELPNLEEEWEEEDANTNIMDEPPSEAILYERYDIAKLIGRPEVKWIKEIWFWTTEDPVGFPEDALGEEIEVCMGNSLIYHDYDRAVIDLARVHRPVALLLYLSLSGPDAGRPLARAVLDGDRTALGPLGDALEEAGHPDTKEIRKLIKAEPKKSKPQGGRGTPMPTARPAAVAAPASKPKARPATTGQEVVVAGGYPCAGKTSHVRPLVEAGYHRLNRDEAGGTLEDLHRQIRPLLDQGRSVVLDNLYATRAGRAALLKAVGAGVPVRFVHLETSIEEAMFNACLRMMEKHGRVLQPDDHKKAPYKDDPSAFPVAVLYKYRNDFEPPTTGEGFTAIEGVPFVRAYPAAWKNKAVIFDFDGTLRTHEGKEKFPCKPGEVRAMKDRAAKLRSLKKQGYLILGASNQSGIAKGKLTAADAEACFAETIRQLGVEFGEVKYCPHKVPPLRGYPERKRLKSGDFGGLWIFELRLSVVRIGFESAEHS